MTPAAQVLLTILPLTAIILVSVLYFFFMIWQYKLNKFIVSNGGSPRSTRFHEKLLLIGVVSLFVGLGLLIFFLLKNGLSDSLLGGIIPTMSGLGVITFYILVEKKQK